MAPDREAGIENIARTDIFKQEQEGEPPIDDEAFKPLFPLEDAKAVKICMLANRFAPDDADPVDDEGLGVWLEGETPLGLVLDGVHGVEPHNAACVDLCSLGVHLPTVI